MAIRLRIRIVRENIEKEVIALIKSGYETLEPEILVKIIWKNNLLKNFSDKRLFIKTMRMIIIKNFYQALNQMTRH